MSVSIESGMEIKVDCESDWDTGEVMFVNDVTVTFKNSKVHKMIEVESDGGRSSFAISLVDLEKIVSIFNEVGK